MLAEASIVPIILAGIMNGSFVIPSRYASDATQKKLWFYYSIIGLVVIPWLIFLFLLPNHPSDYLSLSSSILTFIALGGLVFGIGQLFFINAIARIGLALSFAINLGIGVTIGSMFVVFYGPSPFSRINLLVTLAVCLIVVSLIAYYKAGKIVQAQQTASHANYLKGWVFAVIAGITSGFQNITFIVVAFHASTQFSASNSFWVWPPFLLVAAIPMAIGFYYLFKTKITLVMLNERARISLKTIFLATLMGLLFTGSLALYSHGMSQLSHTQQVIGWPAFMVSIILASQIWGQVYGETSKGTRKSKTYQLLSMALLILAIIILAIRP